jgi:hypothetical protein
LGNGAFLLGKEKGERKMKKPTKDDRQTNQLDGKSKDKNDTEKKDFDPGEYYEKRLKELGVETKKVETPKNRC